MITESSGHEADGGEFQEGECLGVEAFPVLGQAAASPEPGEGALDDPTLGEDDESLGLIGAFDDLHIDLGDGLLQSRLKLRERVLGAAFRGVTECA